MTSRSPSPYLNDPVPTTFVRTAFPIVLLLGLNGLLTVVDAALLGLFVGPAALAAVTLVFPLAMLLTALGTMVSSGMATLVGQYLGAGRPDEARLVLAGAHGLALVVCAAAMALFALLGWPVTLALADGSAELAEMAHRFLAIAILTAPVSLLLAVQSDALRSEGRVGFMAVAGMLVSLLNLGLNVLFIGGLGLGVAGSAWGTALAQALALGVILVFRASGRTPLPLGLGPAADWCTGWTPILALGAPRSLSFLGIALGGAAVLAALRLHGGPDQASTIAAYGVITRLMTLAYLPLLGLSLGLQAMVSHSHGAGLTSRSQATLRLALLAAFAYSTLVEAAFIFLCDGIGRTFTDDPAVAAEVARILPVYVALYVAFGPCLLLAGYLQSLGDARRATVLAMARTYVFAIPLSFGLPLLWGEPGIWLAQPVADAAMLGVAAFILLQARTRVGHRWGWAP